MTEKFKQIQEFVKSLECNISSENAVILTSNDEETSGGGANERCLGSRNDDCSNIDDCTSSKNYGDCVNKRCDFAVNTPCSSGGGCGGSNAGTNDFSPFPGLGLM